MKSLIIIGKNSSIGQMAPIYFEEKYKEIRFISLNDEPDWLFDAQAYDVVDFNVVTRKSVETVYKALFSKLSKKIDKYICISTVMHEKESSMFLSMYRKYKLMQEKWLKKLCGEKLIIIRSPDILDSKMWSSIKVSDGVYAVSSYKDKQLLLSGIKVEQLFIAINSALNGEEIKDFEKTSAFLVVSRESLKTKIDLIKSGIVLALSRSVVFNELKIKLIKNKNKPVNLDGSKKIVFYAGGFSDL